jgi:hypothetical protein
MSNVTVKEMPVKEVPVKGVPVDEAGVAQMGTIPSVVTGELCFQFDNDEPVVIQQIVDRKPVVMAFESAGTGDGIHGQNTSLVFRKGDREFRLFVRDAVAVNEG